MKSKAKFDKRKCLRCVYHAVGFGYSVPIGGGRSVRVHCDFSGVTGSTCLKPETNGGVIDLRGTDYHHCQLYKKGDISSRREDISYGGFQKDEGYV